MISTLYKDKNSGALYTEADYADEFANTFCELYDDAKLRNKFMQDYEAEATFMSDKVMAIDYWLFIHYEAEKKLVNLVPVDVEFGARK